MISSAQIRAARALLRINQSALAERAGVSLATLRRVETGDGAGGASQHAAASVQQALEAAGVEFIDRGVRARHISTPEEKEALRRDLLAIAHRSAKFAAANPGGLTEEALYGDDGLPD